LIITTIVTYSFIRDIKKGNFDIFSSNLTLFLDLYFLPILLLYFFYKLSLKKDLLIDVVLVGIVACFFTFLSIVNFDVGSYFRNELLRSSEFTDMISFRTFGLSEALTFTYGITQGIILSLMLLYSNKFKYYLILAPFFLIAVMFNARIGFTPIIIGVILYLIFDFNLKFVFKIFAFTITLILIITNITFQPDQVKTIEWGLDFFIQMNDVFTGSSNSNSNTFDALFGYMLVFPETLFEWIFGSGIYIFTIQTGPTSDVGYVLQLYYGGIIYLILLFLIVFWMLGIIKSYKNHSKSAYLFSSVIVVTTIIVNVKGDIFSTNGYLRLCILLIMYFYYQIKIKGNIIK
jgi:hypothetical protein